MLSLPDFPESLAYIWNCHQRIRQHCAPGLAIGPITWQDIDCFMRVTRFRLSPMEIGILEALDNVYVRVLNSAAEDPVEVKESKRTKSPLGRRVVKKS